MRTREFLLARLDMTRTDLNGVMDNLTDADIPWSPAAGMNTVGDLLHEIARKDMEIVRWLQNREWPDDEPGPFSPTAPLAEMREGLERMRSLVKDYIAGLSDEELDEVISLPERWWEGLRQLECPRSEMLRNISAHEWYHTGQLITYLWSQGRNPNEW